MDSESEEGNQQQTTTTEWKKFTNTWHRTDPTKPVPTHDNNLYLNLFDIDYTILSSTSDSTFLQYEYVQAIRDDFTVISKASVPDKSDQTVLRIHAVTKDSDAVTVYVHNFLPYIHAKISNLTQPPGQSSSSNETIMCKKVKHLLNEHKVGDSPLAVAVEVVTRTDIVPYSKESKFYKITLARPKDVNLLRNLIQKDKILNTPEFGYCYHTYDSSIEFPIRFMIDTGIAGCAWFKVPAGKWIIRHAGYRNTKAFYEIDVDYRSLMPRSMAKLKWKAAPYRYLDYDIEVLSSVAGRFPSPLNLGDQIIHIATYVFDGLGNTLWAIDFCLKSVNSLPDMTALCFDDEKELMMAWKKFYVRVNPDFEEGYNTIKFDRWYMQKRAKTLKIDREFNRFSKFYDYRTELRTAVFASKALSQAQVMMATLHGRVQFDIFVAVMADVTYTGLDFKLGTVSQKILQETKEDVTPEEITIFHEKTNEERTKLYKYAMKDALLVQRLNVKQNYATFYIELARLTSLPLQKMLMKGQQLRVLTKILIAAIGDRYSIPYVEYLQKTDPKLKGYKGATLITPKTGFYTDPVITLDFNSLYPSIMIEHNLCYTTYWDDEINGRLPVDWKLDVDYIITPAGHKFVTPKHRQGLLPLILRQILSARSRVQAEMKKFKYGTLEYNMYNGNQIALKTLANSVYGFAGVYYGKIKCRGIAESVTSYARQMLELVKTIVENCQIKLRSLTYNVTKQTIETKLIDRCLKVITERSVVDYNLPVTRITDSKGRSYINVNSAAEPGTITNFLCYSSLVTPPSNWKPTGRLIAGKEHTKLAKEMYVGDLNADTHVVIYGDTDSVMIQVKNGNVQQAMAIGKTMAKITTQYFGSAITLAFEKVYCPYNLMDFKVHSGVHFEKSYLFPDRLNSKGGCNVKRDTPLIIRSCAEQVLHTLMGFNGDGKPTTSPSIQGAIEVARNLHAKFLRQEIDVDDFIIKKMINNTNYKNKPAHIHVAEKRRKRDPEDVTSVGDKIEYVYTTGLKNDKKCSLAEDPEYVKSHGLSINIDIYMQYLKNALSKILYAALLTDGDWKTCCPPLSFRPEDDSEQWKKKDKARKKKHYVNHVYPKVNAIVFLADYSRILKKPSYANCQVAKMLNVAGLKNNGLGIEIVNPVLPPAPDTTALIARSYTGTDIHTSSTSLSGKMEDYMKAVGKGGINLPKAKFMGIESKICEQKSANVRGQHRRSINFTTAPLKDIAKGRRKVDNCITQRNGTLIESSLFMDGNISSHKKKGIKRKKKSTSDNNKNEMGNINSSSKCKMLGADDLISRSQKKRRKLNGNVHRNKMEYMGL